MTKTPHISENFIADLIFHNHYLEYSKRLVFCFVLSVSLIYSFFPSLACRHSTENRDFRKITHKHSKQLNQFCADVTFWEDGCTDTENYKDPHGFACSDWKGYDCHDTSHGYTTKEIKQLVAGCCATCSATDSIQYFF